jgi:hypothetical protein
MTRELNHQNSIAQYIESDDLVQIEHLLNSGMRPDDIVNEHQDTAIIIAAKHGNAKIIKLLLDYGADINHGFHRCRSALDVAAAFDHSVCVFLLLVKGAKLGNVSLYVNENIKDLINFLESQHHEDQKIAEYLEMIFKYQDELYPGLNSLDDYLSFDKITISDLTFVLNSQSIVTEEIYQLLSQDLGMGYHRFQYLLEAANLLDDKDPKQLMMIG